jgi:hypothetical protein
MFRLAFCANAFFEVVIEVLSHGTQWLFILLQPADQQRTFE